MTIALTFPGQGSQVVGMGRGLADAFPSARAVFDEVDAALGEKLSDVIWNGPADTLTMTRNAQPALMAASLAAVRVLQAEGIDLAGKVAFVAGHSLGEYSALAAAGAFSVADAARLLRIRGDAMQSAVAAGDGAMAAILGMEPDIAREIAAEASVAGEICDVANDNGGGQVVVSGTRAAVERAGELAKARGAKRAVTLPVSAPFHSRLMAPAASVMERALAEIDFTAPAVPLVANVLAAPVSDPNTIRRRLVEQVTGMVRWRESVEFMAKAGVDLFIEIGSGRVLSGLAKRIAPGAATLTLGTPEEVPAVLERLQRASG